MTRSELEAQLERAEVDLIRADYTDSTARMIREKADARARITTIRSALAELDERLHIKAAVESMGDRHAG